MEIMSLQYKDIEKKIKSRILRRQKVIFIITTIGIIASVILSVINFYIMKEDLYSAYLFLVPLLAYSFYNVFYQNDIKYSSTEKIILIISLTSYISMLLIYQFIVNEIIVLFVNVFSSIVLILIVRSLGEQLYLRLLGFSLQNVTKKVKKLEINVSNDKEKNKTNLSVFITEINNIFYGIEFWIQLSPLKHTLRRIGTVCDNLFNIYKFTSKLRKYGYEISDEEYKNLQNIVKEYDQYLLSLSIRYYSKKNVNRILYYKSRKLGFLIDEQMIELYKEEIYKYFFSDLELIIQAGKVIEFNTGISFYSSVVDEKLKDKLNKEILEEVVLSIYSSIFLLRKYLDNISSISGKFILQTIARNYQLILKYTSSDLINSNLFQLIELLEVKDSNKSTMKIYYHFLSDISKSFKKIDEKLNFIQKTIWSLNNHEEEISPLVFNDIKSLFVDQNVTTNDLIVESFIKIHKSFSKNVYNRNSKVIKDYIVENKVTSNEKEILNKLCHLFGSQVAYAKYFFKSIRDDLSSGIYSVNDFILKPNSRLIKFEKELLKSTLIYDELHEVIPSMISLNMDIVEIRPNKNNEKDMLDFYKGTLSVLTEYYDYSKNDDQMISAIEWIYFFAKTNLLNEYFRYSIKQLHIIGIKSLQSKNWEVQQAVSENLGWLLFNGFAESNIRVESLNNAFKSLVDFFTRVCEFSNEHVKRFVGTAIVVNYIQFKIKTKKDSDTHNIVNQVKKLYSNLESMIGQTMIQSIRLKESIIQEYFKDEPEEALTYYKELSELFM